MSIATVPAPSRPAVPPARLHPADPADRFVPVPVCTTDCLPPARGAARPRDRLRERVRVARRMTALVALLLTAASTLPLLGTRAVPGACRLMLRVVGVRVEVRGEAGTGPVLLVANHLSWIDVVALATVRPVRLLAKQEVRGWPVVGSLAARSGAVFLDRGSLRSLPGTVARTAEVLREGGTVGVFPEATTWCGAAAGRMRPAAFQAAIDAGVPVLPVAVVLRAPDGAPARGVTFVGEQSLADTLARTMRLPHVTCELTFLPPLRPTGTRGELAASAAAAIGAVTGVAHPVRPPARPTGARRCA